MLTGSKGLGDKKPEGNEGEQLPSGFISPQTVRIGPTYITAQTGHLMAPVQIAYHVPDPARAARDFAAHFGWGPFYLFPHIPLSSCRYRGTPAAFDHTSAYGQAGDIMIELITQHGDGPSVLRDLYAHDAVGVHHVAHFVPNLSEALETMRTAGAVVALEACTATGTEFAMVDTAKELGHMIELYEPRPDLLKFYRFVKRAADGWDGAEPLRRLKA
ncbi:MAG TPA: VOC family protein [Steroidobacteraceae bacterium]